ncbi:Uncharacterised protein [Mycobacterium tuberculosis]|nr:Uncharacterised protein [Mycobacterium tuberculosis]
MAVSIVPLIARFSTKPGSGTCGSTVISNWTRVLSPLGVNSYFPSCERCWVELTSVHRTDLSVQL